MISSILMALDDLNFVGVMCNLNKVNFSQLRFFYRFGNIKAEPFMTLPLRLDYHNMFL